MPCELERKFLDIVHLILVDSWEIPTSNQWISILQYLDAFSKDSQMCGCDNFLKDCFQFFLKVSHLFNFENEFHNQLNINQDKRQDNNTQEDNILVDL